MKPFLFWLLLLASIFPWRAVGGTEAYTPIGQPTVFWRYGEWQTFRDGKWIPYPGTTRTTANEVESVAMAEPMPIPEPDFTQTNVYFPGYGWGYGLSGIGHRRHDLRPGEQRPERRRRENEFGRPIGGLGQTTIGIGQPNVGIGQTTIGIGQPNLGIGQTTIGIGQTTIGIGQPNGAIGQTTIGIGQQSSFIGQRNVAIGQPNATIGQTRIGIGKPMRSFSQHSASKTSSSAASHH